MILRELFYFDKETIDPIEDKGYDPKFDHTPMKSDDTRKTRLDLKSINRIRKASEIHSEEKEKELAFIRQMYGIAANAETGV